MKTHPAQLLSEFKASFASYVTPGTDSTDVRRQMLEQTLKQCTPAVVIDLLEPHDFAAMLTCAACVSDLKHTSVLQLTDGFEQWKEDWERAEDETEDPQDLEFMADFTLIAGLARGEEGAKAIAKADPGTAIATIGTAHGELGKSRLLPVLARALDTALSFIADPEEARDHLKANILPEAQAELAATFGDRLSVIAQVAEPEQIVAAMQMDMAGADNKSKLVYASLLARAWAANLKDRPDWEEILEMGICGGRYTVYDLILAAVYDEFGEDVAPDTWIDVGLDPDQADDDLREMINEDRLPNFNRLTVAQAQRELRERRAAIESAEKGQIEPSSPATDLVEDIDIG